MEGSLRDTILTLVTVCFDLGRIGECSMPGHCHALPRPADPIYECARAYQERVEAWLRKRPQCHDRTQRLRPYGADRSTPPTDSRRSPRGGLTAEREFTGAARNSSKLTCLPRWSGRKQAEPVQSYSAARAGRRRRA